MAKDAYYFSHDSNARQDPKIGALISRYGMEGYGRFWVVVELLRNEDGYRLPLKPYLFEALAEVWTCTSNAAPDDACDAQKAQAFVSALIDDFELFVTDGTMFWSESLIRRMDEAVGRSEKARASALTKWQSGDSSVSAAKTRSRRLSEARSKGSHTSSEWTEMRSFFGDTCVRCNGESGVTGVIKDHIIPIYQGGSDGIQNLQPLCVRCNTSKGPDNTDYRVQFCLTRGLEMPAKWLPNACERLRTPAIKEKKGKKSSIKNPSDSCTGDKSPGGNGDSGSPPGPPNNRQLIGELVDAYRAIPGISPLRGDGAFLGKLYNDFGYTEVLSALPLLKSKMQTQPVDNPLVYLRGIVRRTRDNNGSAARNKADEVSKKVYS